MNRFLITFLAGALLAASAPSAAQEGRYEFGGDQYVSGQNAAIQSPVVRDAFVMGYEVTLGAPVSGDAHLAGFNVNSMGDVTGDVYAVGFAVNLTGGVGGDVTAAGNSVSLRSATPVTGNARLAGANVTMSTPVQGSALVSAQTLTLDAPVTGDLSFFGENLTFAPGARVDGTLSIQAPKEIAVPATVAPPERVKFQLLVAPDYVGEAGRTAENVVRGFWPAFWAAALWWLLLFVVGAALIALMPRTLPVLQTASETRPFRTLGLGLLAFASVLGLVPVAAFTIVGIVLLPFVFIFVVIACSLAYLAGVYFLGLRIANAMLRIDTNLKRVGVLAVSLVAAALLGMIPFVGWLISLGLLVFGFGVFARVIMVRWSARDVGRLQPTTPPAAAAATPGA